MVKRHDPPIVVGVDASTGSQRALMWALSEARRLNAPVHVIPAWWTPSEYTALGLVTPTADDGADRRIAGEELTAPPGRAIHSDHEGAHGGVLRCRAATPAGHPRKRGG